MKRLLFGIIATAAILAMANAAHAQEAPALSVPITTVTRGEPGSLHVLASAPSGALEGQTCSVIVEADNNGSVHPGNALLVSSVGDAVVLPDFEREAGAVTTARSTLTIGATLTLTLRLGDDIGPNGLVTSSGGAIVSLVDCVTPPPPTTAPPVTTPVTAPPPSIGPPLPPVTAPPATPPVLPHTGASPWLAIVGGVFLISGVSSVAIGKGLKARAR